MRDEKIGIMVISCLKRSSPFVCLRHISWLVFLQGAPVYAEHRASLFAGDRDHAVVGGI